jgi:hypothetical protein
MSHVDEGLIHAWIDGAFPPDDAYAVEIAAHLEQCEQCRARVEEAKRLRDRAAFVLRQMAPQGVRVEPFEAVVAARREGPRESTDERSRAVSPRARRRAYIPIAWAASIMLAVTAGWIARGVLPREPSPVGVDSRAARLPAESAADAVSAMREVDEQARSNETNAGAATGALRDIAVTPVVVGAQQEGVSQRGQQAAEPGRRGEDSARRESQQVAGAAAPQAVPPRSAQRLADEALRARTEPEIRQARVRDDLDALAAAKQAFDYASVGGWLPITLRDAAARLGREPLQVEALAIDSVHALEADGTSLVRLRQKLDASTVVELLQRSSPSVTALEERTRAQNLALLSQVTVTGRDVVAAGDTPAITLERNGLLLVLRAPLSLDSLRALAARIR